MATKKEPKMKKEVKTTEAKTNETPVQVKNGRVVSVKLAKTATVLIESRKTHRLYNKSFKRSKRYLVHDELGVKEGDLVEIVKIRPMSKLKHWQIIKVVGRDLEAIVNEELKSGVAEAIAEVMPEEKPEDQNIGTSEDQTETVESAVEVKEKPAKKTVAKAKKGKKA